MKQGISAIALAVALGGFLPDTAIAQSGASENGDIIVTARRVEERLQDVPISITVYNQEQLANRNITNAADLAAFTPSLNAEGRFGATASSYSIRGFVQDIGTAPSVGVYFGEVVAPRGPAPSTPAGDGAGPGMFFDLQNVQVLKGPQGTLFGRNTTGGAVILVPQKPTDRFEGYVEASMGNYDMRRIQAVVNTPLSDNIRLRLGVDHQKRDGYMKNLLDIGPSRFNDIDYIAVRGSLVIDLTPDIENYTIGYYTKSDTNGHVMRAVSGNCVAPLIGQICGSIAAQKAAGFHTLVSDMADASDKVTSWQAINNTKWQASDDLTVRNIVSYGRLKTDAVSPTAGTNFVVPANGFGPGIPSVASRFNLFVRSPVPGGHSSNHQTFTEEFRLEGSSLGGDLTYQAGAYYEDVKPKGPVGVQTTSGMWCSNPSAVTPSCVNLTGTGALNYTMLQSSFRSKGVYAQATYAVVPKIKLTAGVRYTWDTAKTLTRRISYAFTPFVQGAQPLPFLPLNNLPGNYYDIIPNKPALIGRITRCSDFLNAAPPLCELRDKAKFDAPTWLIGIDYNPTPDVLIYAKYTRGYRTGTIKADVPAAFHTIQPESVDTWEIGSKISFNGAVRGNFNIAGFYNNFRNQQIQVNFLDNPTDAITVPPLPGLANVGKSRIWGIETDTRLHLLESFTIDAAYTYLNTKVRSVTFPSLPPTDPYLISGEIRKGYPLVYSPKHKLTITGTYKLPVDESVGEVSVGATYTLTSKQLYSYNGLTYAFLATQQPGWNHSWLASRHLLNLNLNWSNVAGKPLDLGLFMTNATNRKYYVSGFGLSTYGMEAASAAEPRMYGMRVRVRFGN